MTVEASNTGARQRIAFVGLALVVPFVLQAAFVVAMGAVDGKYPESVEARLSYVPRPLSIVAGFAFLVRAFGPWAAGIAIFYLPIMW